ncbi:GNAT family N-acetyltransferase [Pseudoalteromonas carrageenovora]|uniref:GNAT family N-acetyltransferase n=1 Tax=Pseudoalteromonas carrageenovora TaxID=227 RepID=UPI00311FC7AF
MGYRVTEVDWNRQKSLLQQIRERVFVYELHIPKKVEFDSLDEICQHVLVTDESEQAVATGRLCSDGLIGRIAVLPEHRNRLVYQSLLNFIVKLAARQGINTICINCILNEVQLFNQNGFIKQGCVFMEAGIPRQRMQCEVDDFVTKPFTLVH